MIQKNKDMNSYIQIYNVENLSGLESSYKLGPYSLFNYYLRGRRIESYWTKTKEGFKLYKFEKIFRKMKMAEVHFTLVFELNEPGKFALPLILLEFEFEFNKKPKFVISIDKTRYKFSFGDKLYEKEFDNYDWKVIYHSLAENDF